MDTYSIFSLIASFFAIITGVIAIWNFIKKQRKGNIISIVGVILSIIFIQQLILNHAVRYKKYLIYFTIILGIIIIGHSIWAKYTTSGRESDTEGMKTIPLFCCIGTFVACLFNIFRQESYFSLIDEQAKITMIDFVKELSDYRISFKMFQFLLSNILPTLAYTIILVHIFLCILLIVNYLLIINTRINYYTTHNDINYIDFGKSFVFIGILAMFVQPSIIYPLLTKLFSLF